MIYRLLDAIEDCIKSKQPYFYFNSKGLTVIPKEIKKLKHVRVLDLSNNSIKSIPSEISELTELKILDLSDNQLEELPIEFGILKKLDSLNLSKNRIREIPIEFANLNNLNELKLYGNPLTLPPLEIANRGISSIRNYLQSIIESQESVRLYEAKLLIVGEGNVGKTFLLKKIVFNQQSNEIKTTEGINIEKWEIQRPEATSFRVNFWDFGGQEIYHSTHQFFLTKRSLYLFVWNARTDDNLLSFDYWLNAINLLGDAPPIIIVQNKIDERKKNLDRQNIVRKFPSVVSFHDVSAKEDINMEYLVEDIENQVLALEHVGDTLPKVWVEIRMVLERLDKNFISYQEYRKICEDHGLDRRRANYLSEYLHDLGVFLHFQNNSILRNLVFLKPEWATNAVYKLVDTRAVIDSYGRFSFSLLNDIWEGYPDEYHIYLVELMKKFELCFQLSNHDEYIIPELLAHEKPGIEIDFENSIFYKYDYPFMPKGIISRFIVRNHDIIDSNLYWKNGVVLSVNGTKAVIVSDRLSRYIMVSITGYDKKSLLAIVRREFEYIHSTLNDVYHRKMLPCKCSECKGSSSPYYYNYDVLKRHKDKKKINITCERSIEDVKIELLIKGFEGNISKGDEKGNSLIKELRKIPSGKSWNEYEKISSRILKYLFKDHFKKFKSVSQSATKDKTQRRDFIINNNYADPTSFWAHLKSEYGCNIIVFEFKNYSKSLEITDLSSPQKYLNGTAGRAVIVLSRKGLSENARSYQVRAANNNELILCLSDQDIVSMIHEKMRDKDPSDYLHDLAFRIYEKV